MWWRANAKPRRNWPNPTPARARLELSFAFLKQGNRHPHDHDREEESVDIPDEGDSTFDGAKATHQPQSGEVDERRENANGEQGTDTRFVWAEFGQGDCAGKGEGKWRAEQPDHRSQHHVQIKGLRSGEVQVAGQSTGREEEAGPPAIKPSGQHAQAMRKEKHTHGDGGQKARLDRGDEVDRREIRPDVYRRDDDGDPELLPDGPARLFLRTWHTDIPCAITTGVQAEPSKSQPGSGCSCAIVLRKVTERRLREKFNLLENSMNKIPSKDEKSSNRAVFESFSQPHTNVSYTAPLRSLSLPELLFRIVLMDHEKIGAVLRDWLGWSEREAPTTPEQDYTDTIEALNALRSLFKVELERRSIDQPDQHGDGRV